MPATPGHCNPLVQLNAPSVAEIVEAQGDVGNVFFDQRHGGLQVIPFGSRHAHRVALNGGLHFELAVFDHALDFFGHFSLDAVAHLDDLLDLVAAHLLYVALIQKAHIDVALGELVAQDIFNLRQLEFRIANQGDVFFFQVDGRRRALEIKTRGNFLGGVFHSIFNLHKVGFTDGIKRRHGGIFGCDNLGMVVEKNVPLQPYNTFHIVAKAHSLVRIASLADLQAVIDDALLRPLAKFVLGGGSNIVLTGDVKALVLKVELMGCRLVEETPKAFIVEAGAGENWHDLVAWTLHNGYPGLENLALIPGTVGGAPVQNIGAYGLELQDRFESLDAVNLVTGERFTLNAAQCGFGYRDSVFKHTGNLGLAGRALITHVRFRLQKPWKPVLGYADLDKKMRQTQISQPAAQQIFDWVCEIRRAKLPDPKVIGNAGSFFKNPTVTPEQCADIIAREPGIVHYRMDNGSVKLAAGWLIDACGWKGKSVGQAGVYEKQALVLVNRGGSQGAAGTNGLIDVTGATGPSGLSGLSGGAGAADGATGGEVMTLAKAIQTSVYERFGIRLEPEPVVV